MSERSNVFASRAERTGPANEEFGPPPELSGRYRVDGPLGRGGVGVVYRGWDEELARPVAIKFLRSDKPGRVPDGSIGLATRLRRESMALAALSHPNVVTVFDVVESEGGGVGIVMELIEGDDLRTWLRAAKHPTREVLRVFIEAGRGLQAAHHAGVVHRDFKPANVMVGEGGRVRVLDFGLAQFGADDTGNLAVSQRRGPMPANSDGAQTRTSVGTVMGTPAYMAPEQIKGGTVDARSDQFSYCVSLFEALEGKRPFDGGSLKQRLRAIKNGPPPAATLSRRSRTALSRGLHANPDDRNLSMRQLLQALELELQPGSKRWVGGGVAVVGVTLGASWMMRGDAQVGCVDPDPREVSWTEPRREQVESAFRSTDVPFSSDSWRKTESAIDGYVAKWGRSRDQSCLVSKPEVTGCLADIRTRFDAVVEILESADADVVEHALTMVVGLPDPVRCESQSAEDERDPELAESQARVIALQHAHRHDAALLESQRLLKAAAAREDVRYEAVAHYLRGESHAELAAYEEALESHQDAYFLALRVGDHDTAAEAAIGAASAAGMGMRRRDEALEWLRHARNEIDRLGAPGQKVAHATGVEGAVLMLSGEHEQGVARLEEALALYTEVLGEEAPDTVNALNNLGIAYQEIGRNEDALGRHERARALFAASLGPDHPMVATANQAIANAFATLGRSEEAVRTYAEVITALEKSMSADHPRVAMVFYNIGHIQQQEGKLDDALAAYLEAVARLERSVGRDHVNTAMAVHNIGSIYHDMRKLELAQRYLERSLTVFETSQIDPLYPAVNRFELATVLHDRDVEPARVQQLLLMSRNVLDRSPAYAEVVGEWVEENLP
ncbi:MAG: protein kinase domain-containing protein [Nannocystales bacterium]